MQHGVPSRCFLICWHRAPPASLLRTSAALGGRALHSCDDITNSSLATLAESQASPWGIWVPQKDARVSQLANSSTFVVALSTAEVIAAHAAYVEKVLVDALSAEVDVAFLQELNHEVAQKVRLAGRQLRNYAADSSSLNALHRPLWEETGTPCGRVLKPNLFIS